MRYALFNMKIYYFWDHLQYAKESWFWVQCFLSMPWHISTHSFLSMTFLQLTFKKMHHEACISHQFISNFLTHFLSQEMNKRFFWKWYDHVWSLRIYRLAICAIPYVPLYFGEPGCFYNTMSIILWVSLPGNFIYSLTAWYSNKHKITRNKYHVLSPYFIKC